MTAAGVRLGLRANAGQFALLVALNSFVGAMVGLERSVLPLIGKDDFGLSSKSAILSFVVAFGIAKAVANLAAGGLAERVGRKRLLVLGWLFALPAPLLIATAPSWWVIVGANVFLGLNQGLAWSMTVVMKIDLVGPRRRGLALGLNESAGYLGVALAAFATGALAASYAPRTLVWAGAAVIAGLGTLVSLFFIRDTGAHVDEEQRRRGAAVASTLPAHRLASSTTSTTHSRGDWPPSTWRQMARALPKWGSSRPSTRPSGAWASSQPAHFQISRVESRSSPAACSSRRARLPYSSPETVRLRPPSERRSSSGSVRRSSIRP
jgi:predicted MFS family arabinose efflux permease